MSTTTKNVGRVSIVPKGAWSNSTAYTRLDVVTNGGNSYIAKQDTPAGTALTNTTYWMLLAQKGDIGDPGPAPNPNLLDNWYFVYGKTIDGSNPYSATNTFPINQRGQSSYPNNGYTIDRWKRSTAASALTISTSGLLLDSTSSESGLFISQQLSVGQLTGKVLTCSLLDSNGNLYTSTGTGNLWTTTPFGNYRLNDDKTQLTIVCKAGASITLVAVKLELGDTQTLVHQENGVWVLNELPDFGQTRLDCMLSTADASDEYANTNPNNFARFIRLGTKSSATINYTGTLYALLIFSASNAARSGTWLYYANGTQNYSPEQLPSGGGSNISFDTATIGQLGITASGSSNISIMVLNDNRTVTIT